MKTHENPLIPVLDSISDKYDGDIFIYSSSVRDDTADAIIDLIRSHENKRPNCVLLLTTYGGDPDAGYRILRAIKRYYDKLILFVFGACKSTGTLIALGADQIIMSDFGEFGPLDIQLTKDDELSNTSGLSYLQSLTSLNEQIFRSFESSFLNLKQKSGFTITTKTAAEISSKLAVGLISPISAQLDPVKLGEVQRAIKIADAYGKRICDDMGRVARLIAGYPSHSFVIDFEEAVEIFPIVKFADQEEALLERLLGDLVRNENIDNIIINDMTKEFLQVDKANEEIIDLPEQKEEDNKIPSETLHTNNNNGSSRNKKAKAQSEV